MLQEKLYGYRCDYIHRDGHYMTLVAPDLLTTDTLDELEWRMIAENDIPGHLSLQIEKLNLSIKLLYRFTGKRKLSQHLEVLTSISMQKFYEILLSVIRVVTSAKAYMLQEHRYVLKPDFIFVHHTAPEVQLVYLPVKNAEKDDLKQELTELIVYLVEFVRDLHGDGVQVLLQQLRSESFSLQSFQDELVQRTTGRDKKQHDHEFASQQHESIEHEKIKHVQPEPVTQEKASPPPQSEIDELELIAGAEVSEIAATLSPPKDSFRFVYVITSITLVMLLGIVWRIYFAFSNHHMLTICFGLSVMILVIAIVFVRKQRHKTMHHHEMMTIQDPASALNTLDDERASEEIIANAEQQYYAKLGERTTLLQTEKTRVTGNLEHVTELLVTDQTSTSTNDQQMEKQVQPYLIHELPERSIMLHKGCHRVGCDELNVDIVLNYAAISRIHCELNVEHEAVTLKDLGSSNGTLINETQLVPYKSYRLSTGDQIQLGRERYVFQWMLM